MDNYKRFINGVLVDLNTVVKATTNTEHVQSKTSELYFNLIQPLGTGNLYTRDVTVIPPQLGQWHLPYCTVKTMNNEYGRVNANIFVSVLRNPSKRLNENWPP
jgi:hypothetical protein